MRAIFFLVFAFFQENFEFIQGFEQNYISKGHEVDPPHKYPWMVLVLSGDMLCGGALISHRFVLTAAHCARKPGRKNPLTEINGRILDESFFNQITVKAGIHYQTDQSRPISAKNVYIHPGYDFFHKLNLYDILLVELSRPVRFSHNIKPICLPEADMGHYQYYASFPGIISGWGRTEYGSNSEVLKTASVRMISSEECKQAYGGLIGQLTKRDVCAGGSDNINSCQGDSGTPLFIHGDDDKYYVIGVTSMGPGGCGENFPVRYSKVAAYRNWIFGIVDDLDFVNCGYSNE